MAKKTTTTTTVTKTKAPAIAADTDGATPVKQTKPRNSSVPPKAKTSAVAPAPTATTTEVTDEMVAEHAYHMWKNGEPGDHVHHWTSAERKLRGK